MFNYTLKGQGIDIVDTVLMNRGLTLKDVDLIINANLENNKVDAADLKNIDEAVEILDKAIKNCFKIGILIDSDCDGYCSAAMIYHYLTERIGYRNVVYKFHDKPKAHGIQNYIIDWVQDEGIQFLIIPDAGCGSSDKEGQEVISKLGVGILILDHHIPEYVPCETTIIVNPHQEGDKYSNKYLSGAGVTHKFIEHHSSINGKGICLDELYSDLVSLSLVSDMMNLRDSIENRAYLNLGRELINSPFILEVMIGKSDKLSIEELGFSIAPLINSTVRFGNDEERNIVFRSLFIDEPIPSKKRGMVGEIVPISSEAVRIAGNLKRKQDKERDKGVKVLSELINELEVDKNKVIILTVDDVIDSAISGLVANKLVNLYNKPVMLLKNKDDSTLGGSVRTVNNNPALKKFKSICMSTGLFEYCSGHEGSFGVGIKPENLESAYEVFNELLKNIESNNSYEVEGIYNQKVPFSDIKEISNFKDLWCFDIKEPLFVVRDVRIHTEEIKKIGNATYTFKYHKTIFTKFYGSKVWFSNFILENELPFGGEIKLDMICKFKKVKNGNNETYIAEIVDVISKINNEYDF